MKIRELFYLIIVIVELSNWNFSKKQNKTKNRQKQQKNNLASIVHNSYENGVWASVSFFPIVLYV